MTMYYLDPARADLHTSLPDLEVWYVDNSQEWFKDEGISLDVEKILEKGWYWWSCLPGCLPDGDPCGPFDTEREALADARDNWSYDAEAAHERRQLGSYGP